MKIKNKHICILISGKGGLLKTVIDKKDKNVIIDLIISTSNKSKDILEYASSNGINTLILRNINNIWNIIESHTLVDGVLLLGFMKLLKIPSKWEKKVINVHPSLLPLYGGKGMYGENVYRAILKNEEKKTGSTFHYCNNEYDKGEIIFQTEVPIIEGCGIEILMDTVIETQHRTINYLIKMWSQNDLVNIKNHYYNYPIIKFIDKDEIKLIEEELIKINKWNFYYTYEWISLCAKKENCIFRFIYIELIRGEKCILPYLKCKIDNYQEFKNIYDAQSPYGYSGPLFWGDWSRDKKIECLSIIKNFLSKDNIIYEFLRLSNENTDDISIYSDYKLINARTNILVDCTDKDTNLDSLSYGWSKNARNNIKYARNKGLRYEIRKDKESIKEFSKMYQETKSRLDMDEYYNYGNDYMEELLKIKNTELLLIKNDEYISGCIIIKNSNYYIYHLGAIYSNKMNLRGSDFYYYSMIDYCKKNNIKYLNIGGGLIDNDSLFIKKKQYKNSIEKFYVAGRVINKHIFNKISNIWLENNDNKLSKDKRLMFYR